jgi:hypothetical protein
MVEKPRPLIIEPEKLVRTPLGTEDPNMARVKSQLFRQRGTDDRRKINSLLGVLESLETVSPVKVGGLDTDTRGGDSLNGPRSVLGLDPLGG